MGTFRRRLLLAVDAKGYGRVDVVTQRQLQEAIQKLLTESAGASGLARERWETQVGGDSVLEGSMRRRSRHRERRGPVVRHL